MGLLANSRFNPTSGILDFWHEFRKPNPYRWPILLASTFPFGLIFFWLSSETVYTKPERPMITYVTTYDADRTDAEIVASNLANQEVKDLRVEQEEELAQRKRDLYKALGAAAGMDVEEIDRRGEQARAAEAAEERARLDEMMGRATQSGESVESAAEGTADRTGERTGEDTGEPTGEGEAPTASSEGSAP